MFFSPYLKMFFSPYLRTTTPPKTKFVHLRTFQEPMELSSPGVPVEP